MFTSSVQYLLKLTNPGQRTLSLSITYPYLTPTDSVSTWSPHPWIGMISNVNSFSSTSIGLTYSHVPFLPTPSVALISGEATGATEASFHKIRTLDAHSPPFLQATCLIPKQNQHKFHSTTDLVEFVAKRQGSYMAISRVSAPDLALIEAVFEKHDLQRQIVLHTSMLEPSGKLCSRTRANSAPCSSGLGMFEYPRA